MTRLSTAALRAARDAGIPAGDQVLFPPEPASRASVGIVHLGIGAFHRAHQAVYTQDAMAQTGESCWGIAGVTQRSASVQSQLAPQDGLYGVLVSAPERTRLQLVGAVREVVYPADAQHRLDALFDDPAVTVVTLTVTEKGYHRDGTGRLDLTDRHVAADVRDGATPASAVGRLVRGLQRRFRGCQAPITVLTCDNLTSNGTVLHRLVLDFTQALPSAEAEPLAAWLDANVTFPCSMVDRIVPATTAPDRERAAAMLGLIDEGLVVAEPFSQWVIEDRFAAARPAWENVGAQLTADVAPYELMKLRILNGSHSTLAYHGALSGYATIAETVADDALLDIARRLIREDVIPGLVAPDGTDLTAYGDTVLHRYENPALTHRTVQIAMDGSQKLPLRLLGTIRTAVEQGRTTPYAARGVAAWMAYVASPVGRSGAVLPLDDPMADRLGALVRGRTDPRGIVADLLAVDEVFGTDLPALTWLRDELVSGVDELLVRS
ncbi:MAG: mannitol dehydrogenase family protein [Dermatophilaceae bacterium]